MGATDRIASLVSELSLSRVPPAAVRTAKLLMLDTMGCGAAGTRSAVGRTMIDYLTASGGTGPADLIGAAAPLPARSAALGNGTLTSALDFDEGMHIPTYVLPAAMAAGAVVGADGAMVLEAFIAGYEAADCMRIAVDGKRETSQASLTSRGWYHVGVVGPLASALAAGKLLGLSARQLREAMGVAVVSSGGVRQVFGTAAKALQAGSAASAGVRAAELVARGYSGDLDILEAGIGLGPALGLSDWGEAGWWAGQLALEKPLAVKRFPACTPAHAGVQATLQVRAESGLTAADVAEVVCRAPEHALRLSLIRPEAETEAAAGFSLPYLVAVALVDGEVGPRQVEGERVTDPVVRDVMSRVRVEPVAGGLGGASSVTVRTRDGREAEATVRGTPYLASEDEVVAKFERCLRHAGAADRAGRVREQVLDLEGVRDVRGLMRQLV